MNPVRIQKIISGFRNSTATRFQSMWLRAVKKKSMRGSFVLLAQIIVPSNRLMYKIDPKGTRKHDRVVNDLMPYQRDYHIFLKQHEPAQKAIVDTWHSSKYLEVMGNFTIIDMITVKGDATQQWGDLKF
jgi:hypothetical protein